MLLINFDELFMRTVNIVVIRSLGETRGNLVIQHLKTEDSKTDINSKATSLTQILHVTLGEKAKPVERLILLHLYSALGLRYDYEKGEDFLSHMRGLITQAKE